MDSRPATPTSAASPLSTHARIERIAEPWSLSRTFAVIITLVLAMVFGSWIASGEFENLILFAVWLGAAAIIIFVRDHWWSPALVISALSFTTTALGFGLSGLDIGIVILALTFPVKMAMKTLRKAEPEMDPGILYWLLIAFLCVHCVVVLGYNKIEGVQLKNIIKAYYNALTPLIFYGLLFRYCHTRTVKPATLAIFCATFASVFFSIITMHIGLNIQPMSDLRITIGWLNALDADGVLRTSAVLLYIGSVAFWPAVKSGWPRFLLGFAIVMSGYGVLLSGGRLSLATIVCGSVFFAVVRRRFWLALPVILLITIVCGAITLKPDMLYALPETIQRGLAPFNFSERQTETQAALGASDEWHHTLLVDSLAYWQADTGSFWIGHGFKAWDYSLSDVADADASDYQRFEQLAIEMGLTENMFSAITNIFGLVGLLLYGGFLVNMAFRLWKASGICPDHSVAKALCEFSLVTLVATIVSAPLQGGTPNIALVYWSLGLIAARPYIVGQEAVPVVERPAFAKPAYMGEVSPSKHHRNRPARA